MYVFSVRVHFLDNSSKLFLLDPETTVAEFIHMILGKCGVTEDEALGPYFGLFESLNGSSIDTARNMDDIVCDIVQAWSDPETAKFVFMIRLYIPSMWGIQYKDVLAYRMSKPAALISTEIHLRDGEVIDPSLLHLQYIQAVYHVITGQYPSSSEQALLLGSIHFYLKFGAFNAETHVPGYLGKPSTMIRAI